MIVALAPTGQANIEEAAVHGTGPWECVDCNWIPECDLPSSSLLLLGGETGTLRGRIQFTRTNVETGETCFSARLLLLGGEFTGSWSAGFTRANGDVIGAYEPVDEIPYQVTIGGVVVVGSFLDALSFGCPAPEDCS